MSDNVGWWGKRCSARRSLEQFQSFLLVLLELGRRLVGGEMSFHVFYLDVLLIQSVYLKKKKKSVYRPSWLSVIRDSAYQYNFRNENDVSALIHPARNHLTVGTRVVLQTDVAISSPHLGFSIQIKPEEKLESPYQVWRHPNDQWKSNKLLTLVITTRRANSVFIICLSLWKWYALVNVRAEARLAYSHFFTGVIHHPPHASARRELHPLFFWFYPIYKSFSLWN